MYSIVQKLLQKLKLKSIYDIIPAETKIELINNNGEVNNNVISAINQNAAKQKAQQIEAEKAKEQPQAGKVSIDGSEQQSNLE